MSYPALWIESRDRLAKSEQLADRLPSSRGVWRRSLGLVICNTNSSLGVYILRDVRRRCVWAVGAARRSCLPGLRRGGGRQVGATVLSGMAVWTDRRTSAFCVGVRPTVALRPRDTLRQRPDTERTCLAVEPTQFTPPHQTRQNSPVCVVFGVAVWLQLRFERDSSTIRARHATTR